MRFFITSFKLITFSCVCVVLSIPQVFILCVTKGPLSRILPSLWMKSVVRIFNIRIRCLGETDLKHQTLYVCNHLSYLDIPVLGSLLPCSFVSKKDVASWPVFGFLANIGQTAYIGRKRQDLKTASNAVEHYIQDGQSLILFPEGTSTDGQDVLSFKSSLFSLLLKADDPSQNLLIQPVSLYISKSNNRPVSTQADRDLYAWHRDMDDSLPSHLWRFAQTNGSEVTIQFHPTVSPQDFDDRKELAKSCQKTVADGLAFLQKESKKELTNNKE